MGFVRQATLGRLRKGAFVTFVTFVTFADRRNTDSGFGRTSPVDFFAKKNYLLLPFKRLDLF